MTQPSDSGVLLNSRSNQSTNEERVPGANWTGQLGTTAKKKVYI